MWEYIFIKNGYIKKFFYQQLLALTDALNRLADVYESKQNPAVVEWVKEIAAKYTDDGYKPLSDERLEEFYTELPYVRYSGLQMKHDSSEEGNEFALIVEKFIVNTET